MILGIPEPESVWDVPPIYPVLGDNEVHVWRVVLDAALPYVSSLEQTLATDERFRAAQFRFQKDRTNFIVTRGILRTILGRYLAKEPHSLRFDYNQYGKPFLSKEFSNTILSFNVTHSRGLALYAITHYQNIGIDLEYITADIEYEQIAKHFFSPKEVSMLRAVPKPMQARAFFHCWTRKEAYVKARGLGLSLDLSEFDVSLTPGDSAAILSIREENQDIAHWSLHDLYADPAYASALAVSGHPDSLVYWQLMSTYR